MKKKTIVPDIFQDFIVGFGMSLLWVGYYGYSYNIAFYNSPVINWFALLLWGVWLMLTLRMHRLISGIVATPLLSLGLTWMCYFSLLLCYEYIGYYVLEIRLETHESPLVFGVIHGKPVLKCYYMTAGVIAVQLNRLAKKYLDILKAHPSREPRYHMVGSKTERRCA